MQGRPTNGWKYKHVFAAVGARKEPEKVMWGSVRTFQVWECLGRSHRSRFPESGVKMAPGQMHAVVVWRYLQRMNSMCKLQGMIKNVLEEEKSTPVFNGYAFKRGDANVRLFFFFPGAAS